MTDPQKPLPPDVADALARGNKVEAIARMRAATGMSLASAKDAVEGRASVHLGREFPAPAIPADVLTELARGNKVEAIRRLREATGLGLKESKDAIDALAAKAGPAAPGLSPGEVPRVVSAQLAPWLLLVAVLVGAVLYFKFG